MSWQMNQIRGILQEQHCLASLGWDVSQIWEGLPHGNTKPMEIRDAKFISHPLPWSASSISQLGQAQGYQHPTSPPIKPAPPFSLINRMSGCAGEGRSLGTFRSGELVVCRRNVQSESPPATGLSFPQTGDTGVSVGARLAPEQCGLNS